MSGSDKIKKEHLENYAEAIFVTSLSGNDRISDQYAKLISEYERIIQETLRVFLRNIEVAAKKTVTLSLLFQACLLFTMAQNMGFDG